MGFARQVLVVVWFSVSYSVFASESAAPKRHQVFAHYMVCFAAQGEAVDDYKREIQEAQAAGIDGFALNCGAWHNEPHYPRRVKAIYQAAQELKTGFQLFFSVDFAGLKQHPPGEFESYVLDMRLAAAARGPNCNGSRSSSSSPTGWRSSPGTTSAKATFVRSRRQVGRKAVAQHNPSPPI